MGIDSLRLEPPRVDPDTRRRFGRLRRALVSELK
jgi:hypothetical protein